MSDAAAPPAGTGRSRPWLVPLLLTALPCLWFWRGTIGRIVLAHGDGAAIFLPMRRMFAEQVAAGILPLWNPRVFAGTPFFAAMQTGMLYPFTWLFLVVPPVAAMNILVIAHFAGAALAAYAYARTIGCRPLAAGLTGVVYAFGGFMVGHMGNIPVCEGLPWMPVLLIAMEHLRHRLRLRDGLLGTAAVLFGVFTGDPHIASCSLMVAALYVVLFAVLDRPPVGRLRYVGAAALAVTAGVALAGVQLVPAAELAAQSARPGFTYEDVLSVSLPARQLPMLLFPFLFGGTRAVPYWGEWSLLELSGSPGIVPLMLAGAAAVGIRRDPLVRVWVLLAVWSLLVALGGLVPLARLMYQIPLYDLLRAPVRNLAAFDLVVAVLAGIALDRLSSPRGREAFVASATVVATLTGAVVLGVVIAGAALLGVPASASPGGTLDVAVRASLSLRSAAVIVPFAVALIGAALAAALAARPRVWPIAALVALTAVELALQTRMLPLIFPRPEQLLKIPDYVDFLDHSAARDDVARAVFSVPGDVRTVNLLPASWGVSMINGYDPMPLARYTELVGGLNDRVVIPEAALTGPARFLDILNARFLVLDFRASRWPPIVVDDIKFARAQLGVALRRGEVLEFALPSPVFANAVAAVTSLNDALRIGQDTPVLRIDLIAADGAIQTVWWRAGMHTSESAWDRPDIRSMVPHAKARVAETLPGGGDLYFGMSATAQRLEVSRVRITSVAPSGVVDLARMSVYDAASGRSHPLTLFHRLLAGDNRWQQRFRHGDVLVLENRDALPRVWLVPATQRLDASAVLRTIQNGALPDGRPFDPHTLALVEDGPEQNAGTLDATARAYIVKYTPTRIVLHSRAGTPTFLVLSEIMFPGWQGAVDGAPATIWPTDYVLRGLQLPAGKHRIELVYAPRSLRIGAAISAVALITLIDVLIRRLRERSQTLTSRPSRE